MTGNTPPSRKTRRKPSPPLASSEGGPFFIQRHRHPIEEWEKEFIRWFCKQYKQKDVLTELSVILQRTPEAIHSIIKKAGFRLDGRRYTMVRPREDELYMQQHRQMLEVENARRHPQKE